ncbi:uncharacterized protein LOC110861424 isoform X2 [Folsomia candida]|uniref:uncharacterized protein LOC110861424 isoform X2 n=1 Tax=Folsomia candida TaxID=158441 RepID=UPI001604C211|nr:uncharacterized protein LOC110861424 isoform X2 [Folsomia candida]
MYWTLSILLLYLSGSEACLVKYPEVNACPHHHPRIVARNLPCDLDMTIINNIPNLFIASGSVNMACGGVWGQSFVDNLVTGNSSTMKFSGRSDGERPSSLYQWPNPYCCPNDGGNETTGTLGLHIYEATNLPSWQAPEKAAIMIKWNAACNSNCHDWIELRLAKSRKSFSGEYFNEDPTTTVLNANQRGPRKEKDVDFVMKRDAVATVKNSDFVVTAKLEVDRGVGNRVMKVTIYPSDMIQVVIIQAGN